MKKKIFSAALLLTMGLATAGMFVSCSDYDDDISNLQEQIDKLVTSDDLSSKITELQNSIATAKSEAIAKAETAQDVAEAAQSAATTAQKAADAAQAKADELEKNGATKAEVEAAQEAAAAAQKAADAAAADAAQAKTDAAADLAAATATMQAAVDAAQADATAALSSAADALKQIAAYKGEADAAIEKAAADATTALDKIAALEASSAKAADLEAAKSSLNKALEQIAALESASSTHATKTELADSKSALQAAIDTLASKSATKESLANAEEKIAGALTDITALKGSVSNLESTKADKTALTDVQDKLTAAIDTLTASAATKEALQTAIDDAAKNLKSAVEKLEAADTETGKSVKEAADKASAANTLAQQAKGEADANAKTLATLQGTGEGSIAATVNAAIATVKGENLAEGVTLASLASELAKINSLIVVDDETGAGKVDLTKMSAQVDTIGNKLTAIIGEYTTMVTSVSLYYVNSEAYTHDIKFCQVTEKANVFGSSTDSPITFTEGYTKTYESDPIVIRVSPTNIAKLDTTQISLINSQGKELSDFVTCSKVEPYTELLATTTRAAASGNGLWKVTFKLKDGYNPDDFKKAITVTKDNKEYAVNFAVAVNNTTKANEEDADRRVISAYDLTVTADDSPMANNDFVVSDIEGNLVSIGEIRNRFSAAEDGTPTTAEEYVWAESSEKYPTPATAIDKDKKNVIAKASQTTTTGTALPGGDDNRQEQDLLPAGISSEGSEGSDHPINIKIDWNTESGKANNPIAGFYVTLDSENAVESKPSELNAWNSYKYEGLNTMFKGNEGTIRIKSDVAINDIIGFRVYAVNLDGTLLDPDGRAFYVVLGNPSTSGTVKADIVAKTSGTCTSAIQSATGFVPENLADLYIDKDANTKATLDVLQTASNWTADKNNPKYNDNGSTVAEGGNTSDQFTVTLLDKDGKATTDVKKVEKAQLSIADPAKYIDGKTYKQTLSLYDKNGVLVKTLTAEFTKVMPKDVPDLTFFTFVPTGEYSFEPLVYNATAKNKTDEERFKCPNGMTVENGKVENAAEEAQFELTDVFIGLDKDGDYKFSFSNSKYDSEKKADVALDVVAETGYKYPVSVAAKYVDKAARTMSVSYVYRKVSTSYDATKKVWNTGVDYPVSSDVTYNVIYRCWDYTMDYKPTTFEAATTVTVNGVAKEYKKGDKYTGYVTWTSQSKGKGGIDLSKINVINNASDCLNLNGTLAEMITDGYLKVDSKSVKTENVNMYDATYADGIITLTQINANQIHAASTENVTFDVYDLFGHKTTISIPVMYEAVPDTDE